MGKSVLQTVVHGQFLSNVDHFQLITLLLTNVHVRIDLIFRRHTNPIDDGVDRKGPVRLNGQRASSGFESAANRGQILQGRFAPVKMTRSQSNESTCSTIASSSMS